MASTSKLIKSRSSVLEPLTIIDDVRSTGLLTYGLRTGQTKSCGPRAKRTKMKDIKRIHIIGGAGSGKTRAARSISEKLGIQAHDLDNIFWDNTDSGYNKKSIPEIRDRELRKILLDESWIIEGVYFSWLEESFQQADLIILLIPNYSICTLRIISRFIKRKMGIMPSKKKETIKGLIELIKWNQRYNREDIPDIITLLKRYNDKMKIFSEADKAVSYVNEVNRSVPQAPNSKIGCQKHAAPNS